MSSDSYGSDEKDYFLLPKTMQHIDLSGSAITKLFLPGYADLEELNVNNCSSLKSLQVGPSYNDSKGKLRKLDVRGTTTLQDLRCSNNQLDSLNVKECDSLQTLYCDQNNLDSLDVSGLTKLSYVEARDNPLKVFKARYSGNITYLDLSASTVQRMDLSGSAITALSLYGYTNVDELDLSDCRMLKSLDYGEYYYGSSGTGYNYRYSNLTKLNVRGCTSLTAIRCPQNKLTSLDVSTNTALQTLICYNNQLTNLNFAGCSALDTLWCYSNKLQTLDVSTNTSLKSLNCYHNQLAALDISQNTDLKELQCDNNQLTKLDVSKNTKLVDLSCSSNQIADTLDVSNYTDLRSLDCSGNKITVLNVRGCTSLGDYYYKYNNGYNEKVYYKFRSYGNPLVSLDMSGCKDAETFPGSDTTLRFLNAAGSGLTSFSSTKRRSGSDYYSPYLPMLEVIDLSNCAKLSYVSVLGDSLRELKVKYCDHLYNLSCRLTKITQLDMTGCAKLSYLDIDSNQLRIIRGGSGVLRYFQAVNNHLSLSQLYSFTQNRPSDAQYRLSPQTDTIQLAVDELFDLHKEMNIGLDVTEWNVSSLDDATVPKGTCIEIDGMFRFSKTGEYKLVLLNASVQDYYNSPIEFIWYVKVTPAERYTVSVQSNNPAWGTVSMTGNGTYNKGEYMAITATPLQGYRFVKWVTASGDEFAAAAIHAFQVIENLSLTAQFEAVSAPPPSTQYTISVSSNNTEWGTVTIGGSGTYEAGGDVTIVATAKSGYKFVNWKKGNDVFSDQAVYTFKATENLSLVSYFESTSTTPPSTQYTVSVSSNNLEWGTVIIGGSGVYEENVDVTIVATAKSGYKFVNWKKGDEVFSDQAVYTFKATENLSLVAYFEPLTANEDLQESKAFVYTRNRVICLSEPMGAVQVFNMFGQCVYSGTNSQIPVNTSGLYVVRTHTRTYKVVVK